MVSAMTCDYIARSAYRKGNPARRHGRAPRNGAIIMRAD